MSAANEAYFYRRAPLSLAEVREVVQIVFSEGKVYAFALTAAASATLPKRYALLDVPLDGEFGHVFNNDAEVRWKRRGAEYDLLVFTERPRKEFGPPLEVTHGPYTMRPGQKKAPPSMQRGVWNKNPPFSEVGYVEYLSSDHTVRMARYTVEGELP